MGGDSDLAGYWQRVGATLLDGLVVGAPAFVAAVVATTSGARPETIRYVIVAVALLGTLIYAPVLLCRSGSRNGQTLGKQALSIRAVRQDAAPIGAFTALTREFVGKGLLGLLPFFTIVDYLFPLGDARRQAIHDKLASTFVVHADAVPDLGDAASGARGPDTLASGWVPPSADPSSPEPGADASPPGDVWAPPTPAPRAGPAASDEDDAEVRGPSGSSSS